MVASIFFYLRQTPERLPAEVQSAEYTTEQLLKAGMSIYVTYSV